MPRGIGELIPAKPNPSRAELILKAFSATRSHNHSFAVLDTLGSTADFTTLLYTTARAPNPQGPHVHWLRRVICHVLYASRIARQVLARPCPETRDLLGLSVPPSLRPISLHGVRQVCRTPIYKHDQQRSVTG